MIQFLKIENIYIDSSHDDIAIDIDIDIDIDTK